MRFIILLTSVLLVSLLVFQNFNTHREQPDAGLGDVDPIAARQKALEVDQIVKDGVARQRREIDEQLQ